MRENSAMVRSANLIHPMKTFHEKQVAKAEVAINNLFAIPEEIRFYINGANYDLYYGPRESFDDDKFPWHGFIDATKRIRAWYEGKEISTLFWDTQAEELIKNMPETEEINGEIYEPCFEDYYEFDHQDIKKTIFGTELAQYI